MKSSARESVLSVSRTLHCLDFAVIEMTDKFALKFLCVPATNRKAITVLQLNFTAVYGSDLHQVYKVAVVAAGKLLGGQKRFYF